MNTPASVAWQRETDAGGIAWLTLDKPGASTNVLSRDILVELDGHLQALKASPPRGVVIRSGKPSGFIAGADVKEFVQLESADQAFEMVRAAGLRSANVDNLPSFPARIPRIELDFVLVSKEIEINNFEVPDVRLSDHRPVLCDFTVRRAVASQPAVA